MNGKKLFSIVAIALAICISVPHRVIARGAAPTASSSVRGTVHFEGKVPVAKPISMSADPVCAKQHPSPLMAQDVLADSKGDLQNVVVFVSDGLGDQKFDPPSEPVVVEQKGCMYQPHVMAVRANQKLELVNDDPTSHNIHPVLTNNRVWNKAGVPRTKMEESFALGGVVIQVKCNVHPWMRGYIAVVKHRFFAVTGKDGSFDLSDLPAGTYTIKAWHEKLGTLTQTVTIGANQTKEISFVFKGM